MIIAPAAAAAMLRPARPAPNARARSATAARKEERCQLLCGRGATATHAVGGVRICADCYARVGEIAADAGVEMPTTTTTTAGGELRRQDPERAA